MPRQGRLARRYFCAMPLSALYREFRSLYKTMPALAAAHQRASLAQGGVEASTADIAIWTAIKSLRCTPRSQLGSCRLASIWVSATGAGLDGDRRTRGRCLFVSVDWLPHAGFVACYVCRLKSRVCLGSPRSMRSRGVPTAHQHPLRARSGQGSCDQRTVDDRYAEYTTDCALCP